MENVFRYPMRSAFDMITSPGFVDHECAEDITSIERWIKRVEDRLVRIQSARNIKEIRFTHDPVGLGGQISRRILAFRVAMITGSRVVFPAETFFPYENAFNRLPMQNNGEGELLNCLDDAFKEGCSIFSFDFWKFAAHSSDSSRVYNYVPCDPPIGERLANIIYDGILFRHQTIRPEWQSAVDRSISTLCLPSRYIAVHFRRGDKSVETPYVPAEQYRNAVLAATKAFGIDTVFVASDSPTALQELKLHDTGLQIIFDEKEQRLNNANHKFLAKNPSQRKSETLTALKNLYTLSRADAVVGQDNAHFATLAAGSIALRNQNLKFGTLLNGHILLEKPGWRAYYKIRSFTRRSAKVLFPQLSIKSKDGV